MRVGWHHGLNGHEFEQTPGDSEGLETLVYCSPRGPKELDMTEQLNNSNDILPLPKNFISFRYPYSARALALCR